METYSWALPMVARSFLVHLGTLYFFFFWGGGEMELYPCIEVLQYYPFVYRFPQYYAYCNRFSVIIYIP